MAFSTFTMLCDHFYLVLEHFYLLKGNPTFNFLPFFHLVISSILII